MTQTKYFTAILTFLFLSFINFNGHAQFLIEAERVFDGQEMHTDWVVFVSDNKITFAGPKSEFRKKGKYEKLQYPGATLMPGMIEGHSHMLLYPYNETPWETQVLKESESYRTARAVKHLEQTIQAGITTSRDLGSEGAGYSDVGLRDAINDGIIYGPRLFVAGPAIVATGSYAPFGYSTEIDIHKGAQEADGDELYRISREQIGGGADFIKVYADYRWGPNGEAMPTFTQKELEIIVSVAKSSGRYVVAHATSAEAIRRAVLAGVETIEHGTGATEEILNLMKEKNVALCPTLAAGEAISMYQGWQKGEKPEPARVVASKEMFKRALESGVKILAGGDVGVFSHGDNAREFVLMNDYGMPGIEVLRTITSGNAEIMHLEDQLGKVAPGLLADLIIVNGNPSEDVEQLKDVIFVMKDGEIIRKP